MPVSIRHRKPSRKAIIRSVASSTAIETGERIADLEAKLLEPRSAPFRVALAIKPPKRAGRG